MTPPAVHRRSWALTEREMQVLRGVVDGLTNGEIGRQLYLSEDTVKTHLRALNRKLGVNNRVAATREAIQRGLVSLPGVIVTNPGARVPDTRPCHPQRDPAVGTVILRADQHDAALLASAWAGGAPVSTLPDMVRVRALQALHRLAGTATVNGHGVLDTAVG